MEVRLTAVQIKLSNILKIFSLLCGSNMKHAQMLKTVSILVTVTVADEAAVLAGRSAKGAHRIDKGQIPLRCGLIAGL